MRLVRGPGEGEEQDGVHNGDGVVGSPAALLFITDFTTLFSTDFFVEAKEPGWETPVAVLRSVSVS